MSRATPFSRLEVQQRSQECLVNPALIEKLVEIAGAASKDTKEKLRYKLDCTIRAYRARRLGDKQESPARIVAALKPGVKAAKELRAWLDSLPVGVLIELQAGGLEEHLHRIINRANYWQRHVEAGRPTGEDAANLDLRWSLKDIYSEHCRLSLRRHKNPKERKRRDPITITVPQACRLSGYGPTTVWRLIKERRLKVVRVPGVDRTLVDYDSLRQLLAPASAVIPPTKRGRGRPRKVPAQAEAAAVS